MYQFLRNIGIALGLFAVAGIGNGAENSFLFIPDTVSDAARERLARFEDPTLLPPLPDPGDAQAWREHQQKAEQWMLQSQKAFASELGAAISERNVGDVRCLEVRPKGWQDGDQRLLVYVHGGAYVSFSADSMVGIAAYIAHSTGLRVLSVDYTLAPHARWQQVTGEVVSVLAGLAEQGVDMSAVGLIGGSAGGSLIAGSVLRARDEGLEMPAALVLWSPWSDISDGGDSYTTLRHAEPTYLYEEHLAPAALAYADEKDHRHPWVSPVYGDYSKGFPPTLIQGGSKEIFLSNFLRHYQAIDQAGGEAKLDLYDGMTHVFQATMMETPEAEMAMQKTRKFLLRYLNP